jgi:hypothetical protein
MPPANLIRHSTPGVHKATEHHRGSMHECLYMLMHQHLTVQLTLPHGTKTRKTDSDSVRKYRGGLKFSKLKNWLTNLVVLFKVEQYGGDTQDRECTAVSGWRSQELVPQTRCECQPFAAGLDI